MPGRIGALIKFAAVAGPTIYKVVKEYGPTLLRLANQHPQAYDRVQTVVKKLGSSGPRGEQRSLTKRIEAMRTQVNYLIASADNDEELRQAGTWKKQLDRIEHSVPLLEPMSARTARRERKMLQTKLDKLAAQILERFIEENADDAETGTTPERFRTDAQRDQHPKDI